MASDFVSAIKHRLLIDFDQLCYARQGEWSGFFLDRFKLRNLATAIAVRAVDDCAAALDAAVQERDEARAEVERLRAEQPHRLTAAETGWPDARTVQIMLRELLTQEESKRLQQTSDRAGDWPEDAGLEQYFCSCAPCGRTFVGHKRRVVCRLCAAKKEAGDGKR